ncbi:MAG: metal-dependent transcriptional regulator [Candidatus Micrarchaeia archaeon]
MIVKFTRRERDCLEEIRRAEEINLTRLSRVLNIKPPTTLALAQRLVKKGMVLRDKNNLFRLTEAGEKSFEKIIFRHRVLETLLANNGVSANDACRECKKMDFLVSDKVVKELFKKLHEPKDCPHGKPIRITS